MTMTKIQTGGGVSSAPTCTECPRPTKRKGDKGRFPLTCSTDCHRMRISREAKARRVAARAGRRCDECKGPIPYWRSARGRLLAVGDADVLGIGDERPKSIDPATERANAAGSISATDDRTRSIARSATGSTISTARRSTDGSGQCLAPVAGGLLKSWFRGARAACAFNACRSRALNESSYRPIPGGVAARSVF